MPGRVLRCCTENKQGLEEEDVLELGCGEFAVLDSRHTGSSLAWRKAQGNFISIHSTESSGMLRTEGEA